VSLVARVGAKSYDEAGKAVFRAVELLGGPEKFSSRGSTLLIKPNLLAPHAPEEAVTTHPEIVAALIELALEAEAKPVVGDSPGLAGAQRAAKKAGILEVCERFGVPLIDLGAGGFETRRGATFRSIELASEALETGHIWNAAKWKTHSMTGMTLGVKNLFGCVPGTRKAASHFRAGRDHEVFASFLLDIHELINPCLTVLDGITAMEGPGPSRGSPVSRSLVLASADACALDHEAVRLSGFSPSSVPTVALSIKRGLLSPASIEITGDEAEVIRFRAAPGHQMHFPFLPQAARRLIRRFVSPPPRFGEELCNGCAACVSACPSRALKLDKPPKIDESLCIRCYCCQELCPLGAVRVSPAFRFFG
jgi:uncharacterized protein (DUF362 family)/Pyruvate/2-oxoacid:ferredoxin oxidoreductase delta subunit